MKHDLERERCCSRHRGSTIFSSWFCVALRWRYSGETTVSVTREYLQKKIQAQIGATARVHADEVNAEEDGEHLPVTTVRSKTGAVGKQGSGAAASKTSTAVTRRKLNAHGVYDQKTPEGSNSHLPRPAFAPDESKAEDLAIDRTLALVHGIHPDFVAAALEKNYLQSAYARLGPKGRYGRPSDLRGGGSFAVYTRAVGIGAGKKWSATGSGVGSGKGSVQLVFKPDVLLKPSHIWRASSVDNMGAAPKAGEGTELTAQAKWGLQTLPERNRAFNQSITTDAKGGPVGNNEQMHWERLPLDGLRAVIYRKGTALPKDLKDLLERRRIKLIGAGGSDMLRPVLQRAHLIDATGHWIEASQAGAAV